MQQNSKIYGAFLAAVLIGGGNFIAVSFSNQELPPFFGAALRFALAALVFYLIALVSGVPLARGRQARGAVYYGLLGFGVAYALLYYALVGLPAGTASIIMAAVPLATHIIAVLVGQEKLSSRGLLGGLVAIAGILVLSSGSLAGEVGLSYLLAAICATVVVAASGVVAKAYPKVHPVNMNAIGMTAGTILLAAGSLVVGENWALPSQGQTWLAVGWLVLLGSVGLFQLFLFVISQLSASATAYAIAGMPLVAVVFGALLLDQAISWQVIVGGLIMLVAVYVGAISRSRAEAAASVSSSPASS
jgi:drug/metabolite transporter (DMT)-like permease